MIMAVCSAEAAQHRTISINCVSAHSLAAIALDKVHCKIWTGNSQDAMYSCINCSCMQVPGCGTHQTLWGKPGHKGVP